MKFNFLRTTGAIVCFAILLLFSGRANAQYCIPAPFSGCSNGDYPTQFALTGTTLSINDPSLTCVATGTTMYTYYGGTYYSFGVGGYQDLTAETCAVVSPSVDNGTITANPYGYFSSTYYGSFTYTSAVENMQIYVDFNNDLVFESTESVGGLSVVSTSSPSAFSITIPTGVAPGFYRMRLVFTATNNATYPAIDPCLATTFSSYSFPYNNGEALDYTLEVGSAVSCGVPTLSPVTGITSTSGVLNWTEPSGSTGSEYVITTVAGTPVGSGTATTATTYSATGLTPSTVYYVYVRDSCGPGSLSAWVTETFTTNPTAVCNPPTSLNVTGITSTGGVLNWTEPGGTVGSEYTVTTSATAPTGSGTPTIALTYTASGLTPNTLYYAWVRDSCGPGDFSTWISYPFTTLPCAVPTGLTASGITSTGATLTWSEPGGSVGSQYVITTVSGIPTGSGTSTTALTYTASGLTPSTTYYVYVRDSCGPGNFSTWIGTTFTTLAPPCNPPTGLAVSAITYLSATLSWSEPSGSNGSEYVLTTIPGTPTGSGTRTSTLSHNFTGLTGSTVYYAYVRDSCGPGYFSPWVSISFTTLPTPPPPCDVPYALGASSISNTSAVISWVNPGGSVGSEYVVSTSPSTPTGSGTATTALTTTATGLTPNTVYYAQVRDSCGPGGYMSAWVAITFTTTCCALGVNNVASGEDFTISTFPNPVREELTVKIDGTLGSSAHIELMDISGKLIQGVTVESNTVKMSMEGIPAGVYMVRYIDAIRTKTIKITTTQ